jgi:hypothetical protein
MDLKEFVSQTLSQIIDGVTDAQDSVSGKGGAINPHLHATHEQLGKQGFLNTSEGLAQIVEFDVALTVTEGTGTKGGIGMLAGAVNLGSSGESSAQNSSVSRVRFSVPLRLPKHT